MQTSVNFGEKQWLNLFTGAWQQMSTWDWTNSAFTGSASSGGGGDDSAGIIIPNQYSSEEDIFRHAFQYAPGQNMFETTAQAYTTKEFGFLVTWTEDGDEKKFSGLVEWDGNTVAVQTTYCGSSNFSKSKALDDGNYSTTSQCGDVSVNYLFNTATKDWMRWFEHEDPRYFNDGHVIITFSSAKHEYKIGINFDKKNWRGQFKDATETGRELGSNEWKYEGTIFGKAEGTVEDPNVQVTDESDMTRKKHDLEILYDQRYNIESLVNVETAWQYENSVIFTETGSTARI